MVAIKDFEMPKFCCRCPLVESEMIGEYHAICLAMGEKIRVNLDTGKDDRCPLVEVKNDKE